MKLNIVILAAGAGTRFLKKGYLKPKPFIDINGEEMLLKVIKKIENSLFNLIQDDATDINIHLVTQKDFLSHMPPIENYLRSLHTPSHGHISYSINTVDKLTQGAACTALTVKNLINNEHPLIITDCDHWIEDKDVYSECIKFWLENEADGGMTVFWAEDPRLSYVRVANNRVTEVAEKRIISNISNTGLYFYRKGSDFIENTEKMVYNDVRVNGEFYIAPTFNTLIANGGKVLQYFVNRPVILGSIFDLEAYVAKLQKK